MRNHMHFSHLLQGSFSNFLFGVSSFVVQFYFVLCKYVESNEKEPVNTVPHNRIPLYKDFVGYAILKLDSELRKEAKTAATQPARRRCVIQQGFLDAKDRSTIGDESQVLSKASPNVSLEVTVIEEENLRVSKVVKDTSTEPGYQSGNMSQDDESSIERLSSEIDMAKQEVSVSREKLIKAIADKSTLLTQLKRLQDKIAATSTEISDDYDMEQIRALPRDKLEISYMELRQKLESERDKAEKNRSRVQQLQNQLIQLNSQETELLKLKELHRKGVM
eukprot:m.174668 g.174668  ORF g.174668 m.174668 type:complete len:277 (-) comp15410_c0_seq6:716-1546(-)